MDTKASAEVLSLRYAFRLPARQIPTSRCEVGFYESFYIRYTLLFSAPVEELVWNIGSCPNLSWEYVSRVAHVISISLFLLFLLSPFFPL